jgi:hypothetical protein
MSALCTDPAIQVLTPSRVLAIEEEFRTSPYLELRQLTCRLDTSRNRVVVRGTLSSYYLKQIAQSVALKSVGADEIASEIAVEPSQRSRGRDD